EHLGARSSYRSEGRCRPGLARGPERRRPPALGRALTPGRRSRRTQGYGLRRATPARVGGAGEHISRPRTYLPRGGHDGRGTGGEVGTAGDRRAGQRSDRCLRLRGPRWSRGERTALSRHHRGLARRRPRRIVRDTARL
ncbi:hypothetical protein AVDCRST_MAG82-1777, partial [uncultured Rubrobacteraceae bacterium]